MPYKLQLPTSGYISIPTWTVAANQDFVIEAVFDAPSTLETDGVIGGSTNVSFLAVFSNGGVQTKLNNVFLVNSSGTANIVVAGNKYTWRVARVSNVCRVTITNMTTSTIVQDVAGISFSGGFNFTWIGNTQGLILGGGSFYTVELTRSGDNRYYNANASGGTGTVLPDTINSANNGAQVGSGWSAANWVFYSSGASSYADTLLAGSYAHSGSLLNSSVGYSSALQAGSYAHSGSALGSAAGYSSALQGGAFSYSGSELQSIISNGAQNYTDTLLGGSFAHAGSTLQSAIARNSTLLAGSYSHAGSNLSASLAFYSTLNGGSYSHFGGMLQSTVSGQVTVSIEGYTITFAADDVSGAFAADTVAATFINDYVSATWSN